VGGMSHNADSACYAMYMWLPVQRMRFHKY
jgi:hypothetical protein